MIIVLRTFFGRAQEVHKPTAPVDKRSGMDRKKVIRIMTADNNKHVLAEGIYTRARRLDRHVTSVGMLGGRRGVRQTRTFFGSDSFLRAAWLVLTEKSRKERQEELFAVCLFVISCPQPRQAVSGVRARNPAITASKRCERRLRLTDLRVFFYPLCIMTV